MTYFSVSNVCSENQFESQTFSFTRLSLAHFNLQASPTLTKKRERRALQTTKACERDPLARLKRQKYRDYLKFSRVRERGRNLALTFASSVVSISCTTVLILFPRPTRLTPSPPRPPPHSPTLPFAPPSHTANKHIFYYFITK
jgi:hypothetical protein